MSNVYVLRAYKKSRSEVSGIKIYKPMNIQHKAI